MSINRNNLASWRLRASNQTNRLRLGVFLIFVCVLPGALAANRLAGHPSPYLAMHAEDPVDWRPWDAQVLAEARATGKLIFISSGYFSCHWCHVMQRESYRDPDIAVLLNSHYIPVKVDRELQPGLDARLLDFVERLRGSAGWPLNVILTPDGYPLYGVSYLRPADFRKLLDDIRHDWEKDRAGLERAARDVAAQLQSAAPQAKTRITAGELRRALVEQALQAADDMAGGFGQQSKFPMAPQLLALLEIQRAHPDPRLARQLRLTLDGMAGGGLRDHLGGGFFRYTVDPGWQTPHFEKMLYDNALLARLYLEAAEVLDEPRWRAVAFDTLRFVLRDMAAEGGGFVASLSAVDGAGVEGGHYLWQQKELKALLGDRDWQWFRRLFALEGPPPFEAGYHLVPAMRLEALADQVGRPLPEVERWWAGVRERLLEARRGRSLPKDGKRVASWNGLLLETLVKAAGQARGAEAARFRQQALGLAAFLKSLWDGKRLQRAAEVGPDVAAGTLEDYSFVARGLWRAGDGSLARALSAAAWQRFHDARGWRRTAAPLLPWAGGEPALPDGPLPSPAAALVGLTLEMKGEEAHQPRDALDQAAATVHDNPFWYASWVPLYQ